MKATCVRCRALRRGHADIDPFDAPAGVCPRFEPAAPGWVRATSALIEKLTGRPL